MVHAFDYQSYRAFFKAAMQEKPKGGHGQRAQLAKHIRCQPTHISHVLSGRSDFSPEQTEAALRFFGVSEASSRYIMLLHAFERAGTQSLKDFYAKQMDQLRLETLEVKNYIHSEAELSQEDQAEYYSSWHHGAIHMILTFKGSAEPSEIAQYLRLSQDQVATSIEFLLRAGLIKFALKGFEVIKESLHLDRQSPFLRQFHTQHRLKALECLTNEKAHDLHFSTFFSCETKDMPLLKEKVLSLIRELSKTIKASDPKMVGGLNIDLYQL